MIQQWAEAQGRGDGGARHVGKRSRPEDRRGDEPRTRQRTRTSQGSPEDTQIAAGQAGDTAGTGMRRQEKGRGKPEDDQASQKS